MQEADLVAKMLRAVLQSHKDGVPFSRLQGEYKSLTGEWIPFKLLGHTSLEAYLRSIPGVVRIEGSKAGEVSKLCLSSFVCGGVIMQFSSIAIHTKSQGLNADVPNAVDE